MLSGRLGMSLDYHSFLYISPTIVMLAPSGPAAWALICLAAIAWGSWPVVHRLAGVSNVEASLPLFSVGLALTPGLGAFILAASFPGPSSLAALLTPVPMTALLVLAGVTVSSALAMVQTAFRVGESAAPHAPVRWYCDRRSPSRSLTTHVTHITRHTTHTTHSPSFNRVLLFRIRDSCAGSDPHLRLGRHARARSRRWQPCSGLV